jgi:hypothetical protein
VLRVCEPKLCEYHHSFVVGCVAGGGSFYLLLMAVGVLGAGLLFLSLRRRYFAGRAGHTYSPLSTDPSAASASATAHNASAALALVDSQFGSLCAALIWLPARCVVWCAHSCCGEDGCVARALARLFWWSVGANGPPEGSAGAGAGAASGAAGDVDLADRGLKAV